MSPRGKGVSRVKIQLVVRDDCTLCSEVQRQLERYARLGDDISFQLIDLDRGDDPPNGRPSFITPAVWVNDKLWYLGGFDVNRFDDRINRLTYSKSI